MIKRKKASWKKIIYTVGVIFLISSIIIGILNLSTNPNTVEKLDRVEIRVIMWEIEEVQTYDILDPCLSSTDWVIAIPITENETSGLILGLFNNLLGKKLNYKSGLIWLNKCIDQDRDGIDDVTGNPALTYGKDSDDFYNMDLIIQFTVLDIEKDTFIQEWFPEDDIILKTLFDVSQVIFNILYLNFPLIIIVLIILGAEFLLRQPIKIKINLTTWVPNIFSGGDEYIKWDFYNAGSGGKKTLLNVCYALALHNISAQHNLPIPTFLIIDTPMKNIGVDVNKDIFISFYRYLYELVEGPLSNTQIIIIDKEYVEPSSETINIYERLMTPDEDIFPPLISYYRGP